MRVIRHLVLLSGLLALTGCDDVVIDDGSGGGCPGGTCPDAASAPGWLAEVPPVDLPGALRQANYGGGSCMHASLISVLRWQGRDDLAERWRRSYSGAAGVWDLAEIAEWLDLDYAWTTRGDAAFLEWCSHTRRGAAIHYKPGHAVTFFGFVSRNGVEFAVICDNNHPGRLEWIEKRRFIESWRGYGGFALSIVGTPGNPRPWL